MGKIIAKCMFHPSVKIAITAVSLLAQLRIAAENTHASNHDLKENEHQVSSSDTGTKIY